MSKRNPCVFPEIALLFFAATGVSYPQGGVMTVVAGSQGLVLPTPIPAGQAPVQSPGALAADRFGNLYIADTAGSAVLRISPDGSAMVVAGNGTKGASSDGQPATRASLNAPQGVAVDVAGNLFIADTGNHRVRKLMPDGTIRTVAGGGGTSAEGVKATDAWLPTPTRIAVDGAGNLFIVGGSSIRKVGSDGLIRTVASGINFGGLTIDSAGNLYFTDTYGNEIGKVDTAGKISVVAGLASGSGFSGDGGPATTAALSYPEDVVMDGAGNLYIADTSNNRIRKITAAGIITTVAGGATSSSGSPGYGDGGQATSASLSSPAGVALDGAGNLYIADTNHNRVRKLTPAGLIAPVAGSGQGSFLGEGIAATAAKLDTPLGVAVDRLGNVFIGDSKNNRVRKVGVDGIITTVAGTGVAGLSGDGGAATSAALNQPSGLAFDASGNLYIADTGNDRIRKVTTAGVISTIAGTGNPPFTFGYSGDNGPATSANLWGPSSVALDSGGNLYIADQVNSRIRKVTPTGTITTVAGGGKVQGDGGTATSATLSIPRWVAVDGGGNLYIAEMDRVRKVTPAGIISTFAGGGKWSSDLGEGGPAINAYLEPHSVVLDAGGNAYIVDGNFRVRKVALNGIITTVVGLHQNFCCDGMLASSAYLSDPVAVTLDATGNLYFTDTGLGQVLKVGAESYTGTVKPSVLSVIHAADYQPRIAPYTWISILGTSLAPITRSWTDSDFVNGQLPTQLEGVRVYVAGLPSYISYISPTQINALVGGSFDQYQSYFGGSAPVEILRPEGRSDAFMVQVNQCCQPGVFRYSAAAGKYAIAQGSDGALIGPPGLIAGVNMRPARPGEIVTVYGSGFGPTNPVIAPATGSFAPAVTASDVWLEVIFGADLDPVWSGLIGPGLYQLNVLIPDVPNGDYSFQPWAGGIGGATAWITIQR